MGEVMIPKMVPRERLIPLLCNFSEISLYESLRFSLDLLHSL